ncbi:hypothetical protein Pla52o_55760 [Novipirellula galeiformis]|uniref:Uncharacterized protein n=1 Tax=Novipirellula galeiformis TaxID=2528004 RepID=A0A5C6BWI4_9BACT|nr:hypothetical protein Pla52o_55760 [Novipirellula galeiformis]
MPRPKRADEKDAIYHALNRGNGRWTIFHKDADDKAARSNSLVDSPRQSPRTVNLGRIDRTSPRPPVHPPPPRKTQETSPGTEKSILTPFLVPEI